LLRSQRKREKFVALATFRSGGTLVDIADRDALPVYAIPRTRSYRSGPLEMAILIVGW